MFGPLKRPENSSSLSLCVTPEFPYDLFLYKPVLLSKALSLPLTLALIPSCSRCKLGVTRLSSLKPNKNVSYTVEQLGGLDTASSQHHPLQQTQLHMHLGLVREPPPAPADRFWTFISQKLLPNGCSFLFFFSV